MNKGGIHMHSPTFDHHFNQIALERIEYIRMQFHNKACSKSRDKWEEYINQIEHYLPEEKKYLAAQMRDVIFQTSDEYDLKVFKQGFADGCLFFSSILDRQTPE